jgi:hypothetical protein
MRLLLPDLQTGQSYKIQVRSNDGTSVSEWSQIYDISTGSDGVSPSPASGLSWVVDGTSFIATWVAPTTNSDGSALMDFKDYQITLYSPANPSETAVYYVGGTRFDFPFEFNSNSFSIPRAQVTIEIRVRDTSGNLSTVVSATTSNPAPANVTGLVVTGGQGTISSTWTAVADTDLKGYEVYASLTNGFTPGPTNLMSITTGTQFMFKANAGETWYVKVRAVDVFGTGSGTYASGNATARAITDGIAPTSSPTPTVIGSIKSLYVRWTGITNADPVKYDVYISSTTGFTPGSTTLVGTTAATFITIQALPGPAPLPGDVDTRNLQYNTDYFVKIIARDDDGSAPTGTEASGQLVQATGPDIAAETITGEHIVGGSFTGEEFAGEVFIGNKFTSRAGGTGQGVEFGVDGYSVFRSDNSKKFYVPISDEENSFVDGEFIARGLTVTGGASFQSDENEITADSAITLMRGIVAPSAVPQFTIYWTSFKPATDSLTTAQRTGSLGTFHLDPASVTHMEWKTAAGGYWVLNHVKTNGTRSWFFDTSGVPKDIFGTGVYFTDQLDWERWSTTTIASGAKAGVYTIFRFIPGVGTDWYISGPTGINKYTRLNTSGTPALGNNGTDFFISERLPGTSQIRINFHSMTPWSSGPIPTLPAPSTTYTSPSGQSAINASLCYCEYSSTGFDIAGSPPRFAIAERGVNYTSRTIRESSTVLLPGGSATAWTSTTASAESFECPASTRRAFCWDGSNFYTYGADGYMYKHENSATQFDPSVSSNMWWGQASFYDDLGTTHETKPGQVKSFTMKRRARLLFTPPAIPDNGGADDPKKVKLFMGRGATQPTNANMWLQATTAVATTVTTLSTATSNPLTTGTFPSTNPAKLRNDDDTLVVSGDGSIVMKSGKIGAGNAINHFQYGSVTPTVGAGGAVNIPHTLGVIPTSVMLNCENSTYVASANLSASSSTNIVANVRVITSSGAVLASGQTPVIRFVAIA